MTDVARARTAVALLVAAGLIVVVFGGQFGIATLELVLIAVAVVGLVLAAWRIRPRSR